MVYTKERELLANELASLCLVFIRPALMSMIRNPPEQGLLLGL
jgi:hypothetical protein